MKTMNANTALDGHTTVIKMAERGGVPLITPKLRKDLNFSKSSILKRKKREVTKTSLESEPEPGSLAQESSYYAPELSTS